mmetsp:Transcript_15759/g.53479  ORF Transcript_15759/g.53479 Transcript_15759/m.53479 type:complete len:396 (-) Transcript_15759:115-1302(-)
MVVGGVAIGLVTAAVVAINPPAAAAAASGSSPALSDGAVGAAQYPESAPEDDKDLFMDAYGRLRNEILESLSSSYEMKVEAVAWVERVLDYNVMGGKMNRGLATQSCIKTLAVAQGKTLTVPEKYRAAALGWCVEWLQAFFLVADDIMDASETRRGQPCWYKQPDVKLIAINDSFLLESCVFKILKTHFGHEPYYVQLVDLFLEVTRQTELGQLLDLTTQSQDGTIDLTRFTMERYRSIVKYKTAFYSFYLPVALAMIVGGIRDKHLYDRAREILCIMGEYFQVQDDYLDAFGAPEVIGKIGTDIQDNKCSWLVVQALNRATPKQRRVLETNYGQDVPSKIQTIKNLYRDMGLEEVFREFEEESFTRINRLLDDTSGLPREVFDFLLKKIYKRNK